MRRFTLWWWMRNTTSGEGQTLREEECATCRRVYQNRDMPLYLKMLFFSKFISAPDKQDLFIYFTAITGLLGAACSGRFSPQKRLFTERFRALLLKIQNFKTIFKCRNIQFGFFFLSCSWGLGCIFQIPDFLKKERRFRLQNSKEYFVFLRVLKGRSPVGTPNPRDAPESCCQPWRAAVFTWHTRFTKQTQLWPCKVGENR